jgi:hypothetical protein
MNKDLNIDEFCNSVVGWVKPLKDFPQFIEKADSLNKMIWSKFSILNIPIIDWLILRIASLLIILVNYKCYRKLRREYKRIEEFLDKAVIKD